MTANDIKYIWLDDLLVLEFLDQAEDKMKTKNIELFIGLALAKFCEKQWGVECSIGLQIQNKYAKDIPKKDNITAEQLGIIIDKKVEEVTPTDIAIGMKQPKINKKGQKVGRGMTFQIKSFGKDPKKQNTGSLISYITETIPRHYPLGSGSGLVITIETLDDIQLTEVAEKIKDTKNPFEQIVLIGFEDLRYINFYGLYPNTGYSQFDLDTFKFNF